MQKLRQELPTLENGLVSSSMSNASVSPSLPASNPTAIPSPSNASSLNANSTYPTGLKTPQIHRRRPAEKSTEPSSNLPISSRRQNPSIMPPQSTLSTSLHSRSRSRTLPDPAPRPDFQDEETSDEDEKCEIRRGSGPLLDPYGIPKRSSNQSQQRSNNFALSPSLGSPSPAAASTPGSPLAPVASDLNQKIRVCVRKRPLNKKEIEKGEKDISPTCGLRSINVNEPKYVYKCKAKKKKNNLLNSDTCLG